MTDRRRHSSASIGFRRWLTVGIGVKRWLAVVFLGELGLALGLAFALRQVYRDVELQEPVQSIVSLVTLQFLPYWLRAVILASAGVALFGFAAYRVIAVLMGPFRSDDEDRPLVEVIYQKRFLARGPRVVALGGGTGLSTLLRGLKEHTSNLTAVVTVADDGGSSGKLREQLGVPPVGDIRNCIVALADAEPLMGRLLQYRFPGEEVPESLGGHAIGNLLIAAMTAVEDGDFEEGVRQMNRVLAVRGQVVPASPTPLVLHAALRDGSEVVGQSRIAATSGIDRVWLTPEGVAAAGDAVVAIGEADLIVIGPGSLFTSVLPSLLLAEIRAAVAASQAPRVYVCNVATQPGETAGFDLADHVEALERHAGPGLVDFVLANNRPVAMPAAAGVSPGGPADAGRGAGAVTGGARGAVADLPAGGTGLVSDGAGGSAGTDSGGSVRLRWPPAGDRPPRLVLDDLIDRDNPHHHDPERLAAALIRIVERDGAARRRGGVARTA